MLFCQKCGKEYEEGAIYCPSCGAALDEAGMSEGLALEIARIRCASDSLEGRSRVWC